MTDKIIAINVEVLNRDLYPRLILSEYFLKDNYTVVIGLQRELLTLLNSSALKVDIFIDKSISRPKNSFYKNIKLNNTLIFSVDEEGGFLRDDIDRFIKNRSSFENIELVDAIFCWGEFDYHAWKRVYKNYSEKIYLTGAPRVDYWLKNRDSFYSKNLIRDYFFIPSNFSMANSWMTNEEIIKNSIVRGIINAGEEEILLDKIRDDKIRRDYFAKQIIEISKKYPSNDFVLKPHPAENAKYWEDEFKLIKNIKLETKFDTTDLINGAIGVIHDGCTTGVEAIIKGKPCYSLNLSKNFSNMISESIEDLSDKKSFQSIPKSQNLIKDKIKIANNTNAKEIYEIIASKSTSSNGYVKRNAILFYKLKFYIKDCINKIFGGNLRTYSKASSLEISSIKNFFKDKKISKLTNNTFIIKP